ncbi:hypothetical protein WA026_014239 [Henosepilachna vigintioctopunctata]|uniref:FAS1 domain-containing protein n=1 Tax=Henosepilachna vigintioctopunctata TaxID=420089 RepID=A0AAW1TXA9_9CUCU
MSDFSNVRRSIYYLPNGPPISTQRCTHSPQHAQIVSAHNRKKLQRNTTETITPSFTSVTKERKPQTLSGGYDKMAHNNILMLSTSCFNSASILMNNEKSENDSNQASSITSALSKEEVLNFITNQRHANNTEFVQSLIEFISYHIIPNLVHNPLSLVNQVRAPPTIKQNISTSNTNRSTSPSYEAMDKNQFQSSPILEFLYPNIFFISLITFNMLNIIQWNIDQ